MMIEIEIDALIASLSQAKEQTRNQQQNLQIDSREGRDHINRQQDIPYQQDKQQNLSAKQNRQKQGLNYHQREAVASSIYNEMQDARTRHV